ncbi:hypothetical protein [Stutzerimonas azotifigens]|uniref:hypothetical protein n=1 Tax=Stutzerimonas azotifigens TaxID=291995 RepID=UPI000426550C|nr:hypothetical protein [Stutzerimonas azotifigens]
MLTDIHDLLLLYSLIFASAGFVLGLFYNHRRVFRLEDKVTRLRRTVAHLQRKLEQTESPALIELPGRALPFEAPDRAMQQRLLPLGADPLD